MNAASRLLRAVLKAPPARLNTASTLRGIVAVVLASMIVFGLGATASLGYTAEPGPGAVMLGPGGSMSVGRTPEPADVAALTAAINDKTAKLDIKPSPVETTAAKATRVRQAIKQGDFATARQVIADVLAGSKMQAWRFHPFDSFIACLACTYDPELGQQLNKWVAEAPGDAIPLLIRADFYFDAGWSKRGERVLRETPESQIESFSDYMDKALNDINAAMAIDKSNPYSYYLKLLILSSHGFSEEMGKVFVEGIAKNPGYFPLYHITLDSLTPKWGGSAAAMSAFVDRYAAAAPHDSPLKMLYLALYANLLDDAFNSCRRSADNDVIAPCIAIHMKQDPAPKVEQQIGAALDLYEHYDHQDYDVIVHQLLNSMLQIYGADQYSEAVLRRAATATHSNLGTPANNARHNDYMIDRLSAVTWYHRMLFDNAIEKMQQALRDATATDFSDPGEKAETLAAIYDQLAMYADLKNQYMNTVTMGKQENRKGNYIDMIVYEAAALKLSPVTRHSYLLCFGYANLWLLEQTIDSCTVVLNNAENVQARYWRGMAYLRTNQQDAALRDLSVVAESNNQWRIMAGMQIAGIYQARKDWKGLLDMLNEYRFMYDPMFAAFTYNTRCQAYEELGELQKALDDCTEALKHSSLPDAYNRQQELIQRLSKH